MKRKKKFNRRLFMRRLSVAVAGTVVVVGIYAATQGIFSSDTLKALFSGVPENSGFSTTVSEVTPSMQLAQSKTEYNGSWVKSPVYDYAFFLPSLGESHEEGSLMYTESKGDDKELKQLIAIDTFNAGVEGSTEDDKLAEWKARNSEEEDLTATLQYLVYKVDNLLTSKYECQGVSNGYEISEANVRGVSCVKFTGDSELVYGAEDKEKVNTCGYLIEDAEQPVIIFGVDATGDADSFAALEAQVESIWSTYVDTSADNSEQDAEAQKILESGATEEVVSDPVLDRENWLAEQEKAAEDSSTAEESETEEDTAE